MAPSSICDRTIMSTSILPSATIASRALLQSASTTSMPWGMTVTPSKASISYCKSPTAIKATMPIEFAGAFEEKKLHAPSQLIRSQTTHSMSPEKVEMFKSLDGWAETSILPILKSVEKSWQPQDFLPDPSSDGFWDEVQELRARSAELPDDYLVCLVGDMITEEALPTYQSMLNRTAGVGDETGASLTAWARWTRGWTAEENRHGDLLNKYLYLTGRVDMRAIEKTIQHLIGSGMDPQTESSPYLLFIYTSFQERATFISHGNTARQAKYHGDTTLAQICGVIAADERRHETAYTRVVEKLLEVDPDRTMLALEEMMRKKIVMPAYHMYDGHDKNIFDRYSTVAQKIGVYTVKDYADILEHFIKRWNVEKVVGLSSRGLQAQEYVCGLAHRMRRLEEFVWKLKKGTKSGTFSWICNREINLHYTFE